MVWNENIEELQKKLRKFGRIFYPIIILETNEKSKNIKFYDKRFIMNLIISKEMSENEIINKIISGLWEIDYFYNERGNEICKSIPENIYSKG